MSEEFKELSISIKMFDKLMNYQEEDIAKQVWPYLTPFLTRRHGVNSGAVYLNDDSISIYWKYTDHYKDVEDDDDLYRV